MGVGKTIQTIALILSMKLDRPLEIPTESIEDTFICERQDRFGFVSKEDDPKLNHIQNAPPPATVPSCATLIVAPLSTVTNWEDQILTHTKPDSLKVYVYHGANRIRDPLKLAEYDVVITTYSILAQICPPSKKGDQKQKMKRISGSINEPFLIDSNSDTSSMELADEKRLILPLQAIYWHRIVLVL